MSSMLTGCDVCLGNFQFCCVIFLLEMEDVDLLVVF